jgi:mannose-6-phosphate isomerase-like protein (cupin superfamily)
LAKKILRPTLYTRAAKLRLYWLTLKKASLFRFTRVDLVLYILEGEAAVVAGDERLTAAKDDLIIIPKGAKRGVKALTELTILHVVQPPPAAEDHNEVHAKLAQGRFE